MGEKEVGFAPGQCEKEALGLTNECHFFIFKPFLWKLFEMVACA